MGGGGGMAEMSETMDAAEYRKLIGQTNDIPTEMSAEQYRRAVGVASGLLPRQNLDSSNVDTEPAVKTEFAEWLDLVSPYPVLREHRFLAPLRQFRADWCIVELRIIVEYDGVVHHTTIAGAWRDALKGNLAQIAGWMFLRVNARSIRSGEAHELVEQAIEAAQERVAA